MQAGFALAGRYVLEQLLGQGAVGEVWRATDRELDRPVAVKVIRERVADPKLAAGLLGEARIAGRLRHPGITVVHDVGEHEGQPFIVMELLQGRDLEAVLSESPGGLPVGEAVSLAIQVADALAAAHAGGVFHRDLKPANLFLQDGGQLKICDFGIAVAADATASLTRVSYVVGTPAYMSPEQCDGREAGESGDVYSLGCVLYALLTGRPPFAGGPPLAVMAQHRTAVPAGPRDLRPAVPADLDRLVADLLAKDPEARPESASQVAAALRALHRRPSAADEARAAPQDPARAFDGTARPSDPAKRDAAPRGAPVPAGQAPAAAVPRASRPTAGPLAVSSRQLLATNGYDGVQLWDLATGWRVAELRVQQSGMCSVIVGGQEWLALGGGDGTVRLWDPAIGQLRILGNHKREISAVCSVIVGGRELLATGGGGTVRLWDPATGRQADTVEGHKRRISTVCSVTAGDREFLATASKDRTVRLWDPATGQQVTALQGYRGWVITMCPVAVGGRQLLATGGSDGAVRLWDPVTGQQAFVMDSYPGRPAILIPNAVITPNAIITMCPITAGGRSLLATSGADRTVRLWDLATRRPAAVTLWDPGELFPPGSVAAMCPVIVGERSLLAVGYSGDVGGEVRLWDLTTGRPVIAMRGHRGTADAMCPITINPPEPPATATVGDRVVPLPDSPPAS